MKVKFSLSTCFFGILLAFMLEFAEAGIYDNIDDFVKPEDDFFTHVNGLWLQGISEDPDHSNSYIPPLGFQFIYEGVTKSCSSILVNQLSKKLRVEDNKNTQQELKKGLEKIDKISKPADLNYVAELYKAGVSVFLDFNLVDKHPEPTILQFYPAKDKINDIELKASDSENVRKKLIDMIQGIFNNAGDPITADKAGAILRIEKVMHAISREDKAAKNYSLLSSEKNLSKDLAYNIVIPQEINKLNNATMINLENFAKLDSRIFKKFKLNELVAYIKFSYLLQYEPLIIKDYALEQKDEKEKSATGIERSSPIDKDVQIYNQLKLIFGNDDLNRLCFNKYIKNNEGRVLGMFENIKKYYIRKINSANWMTMANKIALGHKINGMTIQGSHNAKKIDYSNLTLGDKSVVNDVELIESTKYKYILSQIGKPIQPGQIFTEDQLADSQQPYNATLNQIKLPFVEWIPPSFNQDADDAINYGALGTSLSKVIGSIIVDMSLKSEPRFSKQLIIMGANNQILIDNLLENYKKKLSKLGNQPYDLQQRKIIQALQTKYENLLLKPLPGQQFNHTTLQNAVFDKLDNDEQYRELLLNIFTYTFGLDAAYNAYKDSLGGTPAPVIDGKNASQRFFYSFAANVMPSSTSHNVSARHRMVVNNSVRAQVGFEKGFEIPKDSAMFIEPDGLFDFWGVELNEPETNKPVAGEKKVP
ncbi:MAG: putative metallopeptidase [Burkholderiales bacterium]|jgi:putative endopeptidase|nr:putative metallopeptidase [Burkholderiales bacterium]